jgi:integrase
VDKHLDRVIHCVIDKANQAGYPVKKPKKPCHAFRVLYATRRHQNGVDIETLRQELGHSDISTTQIYLRSADRKSDKHRARINEVTSSRCCPLAVSLSAAGLRKPPSHCRFGCSQN